MFNENHESFQDIDFTIWGRENKPARLPSKPRPAGSEPAEKRRKLSPEQRAAAQLKAAVHAPGSVATDVAAPPVFYVKFNFRRPKRKRQDSEVSVDLQELEGESCTPSPSSSPSSTPSKTRACEQDFSSPGEEDIIK